MEGLRQRACTVDAYQGEGFRAWTARRGVLMRDSIAPQPHNASLATHSQHGKALQLPCTRHSDLAQHRQRLGRKPFGGLDQVSATLKTSVMHGIATFQAKPAAHPGIAVWP